MIPRYGRDEMVAIWSQQQGYRLWLEVELLALEGMERIEAIPPGTAARIRHCAFIDINRIADLEKRLQHEALAFLTSVSEQVGEDARFLHYGMTSSDMLDTALAVQICRSIDLLLESLRGLTDSLRARAEEHRDTLCLARTHGRGAEPTTFGLKLAGFYAEFVRSADRLRLARAEIAICKIGGAVGTYATIDPRVELHVAAVLGLAPETVATQAVARDRHAAVMTTLALLAGAIERLATELRHLQRQEVEEVWEGVGPGQKGSSAMPHKRNPIFCENLTGLARLIRSSAMPFLENIALWHERDMSHSSVERVALPDAFILSDFAVHRLTGIIRNLVIDKDRMRVNLEKMGGAYGSQPLMLSLIDAGLMREQAYELLQRVAHQARLKGIDFRHAVESEPEIAANLTESAIERAMDPRAYVASVDYIFKRTFGAPVDPSRDGTD